jgi:two-component system nitrogen regulation response regulator GlnG
LAGAPADAASVPTMTTVPVLPGEAGGAPNAPLPWIAPWLVDLQRDARRRLHAGEPEVWDALTRQFEAQLIRTAREHTRGRRIEAALKLGIGRNTITRKIQELGLDE